MIKKFVRAIISFIGIGSGVIIGQLIMIFRPELSLFGLAKGSFENNFVITCLFAIIMGLLFFFSFPTIFSVFSKVSGMLEAYVTEQSFEKNLVVIFGLFLGLFIAFLVQPIFISIPIMFGIPLRVLTYVAFGYFGVRIATLRISDVSVFTEDLKKSRREKAAKSKRKGGDKRSSAMYDVSDDDDKYQEKLSDFSNMENIYGKRAKVLDTSVIIDGRIADIIKTGFLEGPVIIPEFVLEELQKVADSADTLKRNRGRRGLDILNAIKKEKVIDIRITDADFDEIEEVDIKLLKLAKIIDGYVVTNDYNLNKVLSIQNVSVLNINDLANAVKVVVLPGEEMTLTIVKEGKEHNQGLAYLDDGTMIVIENGRSHLDEIVNVVVTSIIQTSAGKMFFAKIV